MNGKQVKQFLEALRKFSPEIQKAFLTSIARITKRVDLAQLENLIRSGRLDEAVKLVAPTVADLSEMHEELRRAFMQGGKLASAGAPVGIRGTFAFDGSNPRAEAWIKKNVGSLIQGIRDDTEAMTREVIRNGVQKGQSSRTVARSITGKKVGSKRVGGYLGLTKEQARSISRGRDLLSSGDPAKMRQYLKLELRDKRFDGAIKRAIKEGRAITGSELEKITGAHRTKALGYRGRVIAKHETHQAMAAGREEGMRQIADREDVEKVEVRWQHNLSLEPRADHAAMNGTKIELGQNFDLPDGTSMRHPHEADAPPQHTIGCRCIAVYRVVLRRD